ncbi:lysosomal-associated transmembrane protein 5 [Ambystoma mexicanum]|uniref:lysosomal-associated transmembrane protein 5 n=1 Tax=Ambystoma mexicanum TaxID=8296 RepID=UPI0037E70048
MTGQSSQDSQSCCFCLNVRVSTLCLGVYHVVMSVLLLVLHAVEVSTVKGNGVSAHDYYKIADITSSFLLIIMLLLISIALLYGALKNLQNFLLPFLALQVLDFLLSTLTMGSVYIELPPYLQFAPGNGMAAPSQDSFTMTQILDFILSLLNLCSSYTELPAYFNFGSMNHINYFPSKPLLSPMKSIKMLICFSVLFIGIILLKSYMMNCVWKCFKSIRDSRKAGIKEAPQVKFPEKVLLPSYDEAIKTPEKMMPPPYSMA